MLSQQCQRRHARSKGRPRFGNGTGDGNFHTLHTFHTHHALYTFYTFYTFYTLIEEFPRDLEASCKVRNPSQLGRR